jgi:nucleoside-diphosphate kinase
MPRERTFIMLKPDAVQRGLIGSIITKFNQRGFKLVALKQTNATIETAESHYEEHRGKPFFERITKFIASGPVVCMVWDGDDVVKTGRTVIGATNSANAEPGTIRGTYGITGSKNCIHGSDGVEAANREIALWFKPEELVDHQDHSEAQVYERVEVKSAIAQTITEQASIQIEEKILVA